MTNKTTDQLVNPLVAENQEAIKAEVHGKDWLVTTNATEKSMELETKNFSFCAGAHGGQYSELSVREPLRFQNFAITGILPPSPDVKSLKGTHQSAQSEAVRFKGEAPEWYTNPSYLKLKVKVVSGLLGDQNPQGLGH